MTQGELISLARKLCDIHKLYDWRFEFDRAVRRFGACRYRRKVISISLPLFLRNQHDDLVVLDVLLHEIAHALTPGAHHGFAWQAMAEKVGANPERCYDSEEVETIPPKLRAVCLNCTALYFREKKPSRGKTYACINCCKQYNYGRYDAKYMLHWHVNPARREFQLSA